MDLNTAMESVAERMLVDFKSSGALRHRGSKGTVREAALVNGFLSKYLPRTVIAVHNGEIICVDGEVSTQCDVMILDPGTPPFWDEDDYRVVPIECVYGVIEVKSFLDSTQLKETWRKLAEIKGMEKKAYRANPAMARTRIAYGRTWDYVPTSGIVFAYDGADLDTLGSTLAELANEEGDANPHLYIDSVWVLSKGHLVWVNPENGNIDPMPEPRASLASVTAEPRQNLLAMLMHLRELYGTAWSPEFRITEYLGSTPLGIFNKKWDYVEPHVSAAGESADSGDE